MKKTRSLDHDGLDGILPSTDKSRSKSDNTQPKSDHSPGKPARGKVVWLFAALGSLLAGGVLLQTLMQDSSPVSGNLASTAGTTAPVSPSQDASVASAPEQKPNNAQADNVVADSAPTTVAMVETQTVPAAEPPVGSISESDKQKIIELPTEPTGAGVTKSPAEQNTEAAAFTVYFKFDSSRLTPESTNSANELLTAAKNCQNRIKLSGHTCNLGNDAANLQLGLTRANAVKRLLIAKGINAQIILTASDGMRKPAAPNDTKEGQALNRRVELQCLDN